MGIVMGRFTRHGRHRQGEMNKTELAYAEHLDLLKGAGELYAWFFESLKLRLGERCWYTPDFLVIPCSGEERYELHEVKGWWEDDARVKVKACASLYHWFKIIGVKLVKKEWVREEFS